ncbi:hypothetical protein FLAG1_10060 [Fusarium langsethiae]|uniref:Uncharacterized protein n=1 Tax=Fusarium langsethiae TaxID=179993 RepID=A0A0N0DBR4_FUSLA|nr:hypothetical protein FLAG1_10060 [Fusarium langsethiae]
MSSTSSPNHQGTVTRVEVRTVMAWSLNTGRQRGPKDYSTGNLQYPSFALKPPGDEPLRKTDFSSQQDDEMYLYLKRLQSLLKDERTT